MVVWSADTCSHSRGLFLQEGGAGEILLCPFTNLITPSERADAQDSRAGVFLGRAAGDTTHKRKRRRRYKLEGDGGDKEQEKVYDRLWHHLRLTADKRENRSARARFMTEWRHYQRVTDGMCLLFSECTLWPLPTGHALSSLKIEALAWWDTYHLSKWTEKKKLCVALYSKQALHPWQYTALVLFGKIPKSSYSKNFIPSVVCTHLYSSC